MSELRQSSVALLEAAIDAKIERAKKRDGQMLATVTRVDNDGTTWVHVYGGAQETPVRNMTSAASVGDTVNVVFSGLSCMGIGNVSSPSASQSQVTKAVSASADLIKGIMDDRTLQLKLLIADRVATKELDAEMANILNAAIDNATINALNAKYAHVDAANIDTAAIQEAWVEKLLVETSLLAKEGTIFKLDAIQADAANITTGTLDVRRLIITREEVDPETGELVDQKYLVEIDPETSQPSYQKLDGNIIEPRTIGADKIMAHSVTADELTIQNIVGTGGWINLANGTFAYGNPLTGQGISWNGTNLDISGSVHIGGSSKALSDMLTADDVTVTQNQTQTGYDVDIAGNTFSLVNGAQGPQGETGPQGPQGETGPQGPQGTSVSVSKVEYATSTTESQPSSGWSTTAPSTVAEGSWLWVKTTYSDSTTAVTRAKQGKSGTNGTSYYTHVRYSESADGTGHVASPTSATKYIGVYTGTSFSAPSSKTSYKWSKYVGEDGEAGHSPAITTSHSGTTTTIYADGTAIGTVEDGEDGATPTITASKSGTTTTVKVNGTTVATINDGTSVKVSKVEYGTSSTASATPSSWSTTVPTSIAQGKWLWVKTTYTDNSTATTKSYVGTDGEDGKSVAIKSATKADGVTTVVLEETDGTTTTTKTLTIADGEDGANGTPGTNGKDGTSSYVHTAWANSADGETDFSTTVSAGKKYLGVYSDSTQADSTNPSAYSWSLIKGDTGAQGPQGPQGAQGPQGVSVTNVTSTNNTADGGTSVVTVTLSDGTTKTFNVKNGSKGNPGATGPTAEWYYGTALTHTSGTATLSTSSTSGVVVGSMYLNTATTLCYKCTAISGTTATWTYAGNLTDGVIGNVEAYVDEAVGAANQIEQQIYIQATAGTTTATPPSAWVEETGESWRPDDAELGDEPVWTVKHPTYRPEYPVVLVATQRKSMDGAVTCSPPLVDDTVTVIDGGNIITGTVTANAIDATDLHVGAANIDGTLTASQIDTEGIELSITAVSGLGDELGNISEQIDAKASAEDVASLSGAVSDMSTTVELALGDDGTLDKLRDDVDEIQAHISLGTVGEGSSLQPAITLDAQGGSSDGFRNVITNTAMSFMYGDETIAEINKDELDITRTKVIESMQLGNFMWIPLSDGSLAFKWVEE